MEVFILLPGVSGRAGTGCSVLSYTMLLEGIAAPSVAGGIDSGVKASGAGSSLEVSLGRAKSSGAASSRSLAIWSLGGEGGGESDGRTVWPSEPSLGGTVARSAARAPSARPCPPTTVRSLSSRGEKIPGEELPEMEGLELTGGDREEMRRSAGRARMGDPIVAGLIRGDRPGRAGDLPWEDVGVGTPRAVAERRRDSVAAMAAWERIPLVRCGDGESGMR